MCTIHDLQLLFINQYHEHQNFFFGSPTRKHYLNNIWDKHIWTSLKVSVPVFTILSSALSLVSESPVNQHNEEEYWEEPWEWRSETTNTAPGKSHSVVSGVMSLTGVLVPTVSQQERAIGTLDVARVLEIRERQVWESLSERGVASHDSSETVLLSVTGIEEVVCNGQDSEQGNVVLNGPVVLGWVVVSEVQSTVAVSVWDTGDVPENQHEAKLLVSHVPSWNNQFLTLGAGVGVEPVSIDDKDDLGRDIAIRVELLQGSSEGKEVQGEPWDSDLEEHLQVQVLADSWVQWSTHEAIVDVVTGHSVVILRVIETVDIQQNGK